MIKINLLPSKRKPSKKVTELQKQAMLGTLIFLGALGGMAWEWDRLNRMIAERQRQKAAAEATIRQQDEALKEVKNIEDERTKVKEKIETIEKLKKNQAGPVRMLDELSKALPKGVNLKSFNEKGGAISITGQGFTNEDIVRFVDNMKASVYFTEVFLQESRQATLQGIDVYEYSLSFQYQSKGP